MAIRLTLDPAIFRWQVRHGAKMTYAELAKRAGISEPTIYRLTSGQPTKLDLGKLNRICKVLECGPGDLLERVETGLMSREKAEYLHDEREDTLRVLDGYMHNSTTPKPD